MLLDGELEADMSNGAKGNSCLPISQHGAAVLSGVHGEKVVLLIIERIAGYCKRLSMPRNVSTCAKDLLNLHPDHFTLRG